MGALFFVIMFTGLLFYFLTPEERTKLLRLARTLLWTLSRRVMAELVRQWRRQPDEAGNPAPPIAFATWLIVIANVALFVRMIFAGTQLADPGILVGWGGSFGPRTTNGEWWRLVTATFVHGGALHLAVIVGGVIQIGCITERLVGRFAFVFVYLAAGALASLVELCTSPVQVVTGGSGAVLGVYGLFAATWIWGLLRRAPVRIPWQTAKRLMPGVAVFLLYTAATGRLDRAAAAAALAGGAISGLLLAKDAKDHRPAVRRVAIVTADTAALIMLFAVPLRGMSDVRPEIHRMLATETRTAQSYDAAVARFTRGSIRAPALVQLIDNTILPDLRAARTGLDALQRVPSQFKMTMARAAEYLRLRDESWRLRSEALRTGRSGLLKEADRKEWQALDALERLKEADEKQR